MKTKLYIIPAYEETVKRKSYQEIISAVKEKYEIVPLEANFKKNTLTEILKKHENIEKNSVIFGFSMGALVAYCLSVKKSFKKAIICSMSPILGSDAEKIAATFFKKEIVADFKKYSYKKSLAKKLILICGEKEMKELVKRTEYLAKKNEAKFIKLDNTSHELSKIYIKEIIKNL
ncbi:MAG: hypothetical protein PHZ25_03865 [Candidatus Pacebacteria bacterium]|nr:hypothetical protein [Candidatus Paceibacterota bacterium]